MRRAIHAIVVVAVCLLVVLAPRAARAAGTLYLAKGGGELPLERTDVAVDVARSVVSATVTERFTNTSPTPIEVLYVFPLPQRAAVDAMEMRIGSRTVKASIARRQEARDAYDRAVREGKRAALLEQQRPNVFTFSVGNVDPGAAIDVKLHYFEVASYDAGTYELVVPTTVGPRYTAGAPDAARISPTYSKGGGVRLGITVHLDAGTALETLDVPTHAVDVARPSPAIADVRLKNDDVPNRDFVLRWRVAANTVKPVVFAHRPSADAPGYVTLMLEPRHDAPQTEIAPRELFFLLDTSGSMNGTPLATAVAAVTRAIDAMGPSDTFQIVDFADTASTFAKAPLTNTPENRARAHAYLAHLRSAGGTNQLAGIHAALSAPGDEGRVRYVMFFTDGYIGNEKDVVALTRREIGRARIFSFGVGSSVNRYLLDEVAVAGRGFAEYLRPHEDGKELVERFYRRIGKPYLTDVEIDWGGLAVSDARPSRLPDLSAFSPLVVHARYGRAGRGDVVVRALIAGRPWSTTLKVVLPEVEPKNGAISRLWARETIADLERRPRGEVDAEAITRVALAHDLVSAYTSFVAIDVTPRDADGPKGPPSLVRQPSEAPADVDLQSAGGVVSYAGGSASAAPPDRAELAVVEAAPRRGGCAGCTTAAADRRGDAAAIGALVVVLAALARRRRVDPRTP